MAGVEDDYITEADVLPIKEIPSQPWSAKDILTVFGLVLEQLWEEHGSGVGSQV
jgi:hypothetical protein